jgi:hypothetical protein
MSMNLTAETMNDRERIETRSIIVEDIGCVR